MTATQTPTAGAAEVPVDWDEAFIELVASQHDEDSSQDADRKDPEA